MPRTVHATALAALLACGDSAAGDAQPPLPTVPLQVAAHAVEAEVADDRAERSAGLMFRAEMAPEHGMLFVYPDERPRSFWMKNTPLPLSIAYLSATGRVVSILDMEPLSTQPVLSGYGAQYALEMNQGWFAQKGVKVGDKVTGLPPASAE
jgi:uncharacterized membrane protein (UPF0127 family)